MVHLPPGLVTLVRLLPHLLVAPGMVYTSLRIHDAILWEPAARSVQILAYLLASPIAFAARILYVYIRNHRQAALHGAVMPPGIKSWWPGALDKLSVLLWNYSNGYIAEYLEHESQIIGNTFNVWTLYENRIVTLEPAYVKTVLATQFASYAKGPIFHDQFNSFFGTSVFNSDGDDWKFHRSMTRPFFVKDRISDFELFETHFQDVLNQIKSRLSEGYPIDMQDATSRFAIDSASEFLFGQDVRTLSAGLVYPPSSALSKDPVFLNHPSNRFFTAFTNAQLAVAFRAYCGSVWRWTEFWRDDVKTNIEICLEFVDPIIANAVARKHEQKPLEPDVKDTTADVKEGETLLEHLTKCTQDQTIIRDETLSVMMAGMDPVTEILTFGVYMLSQHPEILTRLREEIIAKFGVSGRPTHEDVRGMKYLRAFINEILRLYPALPFNTKASPEPQVWPGLNGGKPLYIPPNTTVVWSKLLMHRRKDLWGPDADTFDPDRFLDERLHKYLIPNPFIFIPFSAGPRTCLGQQFAYNETSYFFIRLLQSFDGVTLDVATQQMPPADWTKAKGRKAIEKVLLRSHIAMYIEGGLWVRFKEAKAVESG